MQINQQQWRIIPCKEYGTIDIDPSEIILPNHQLKVRDNVLNQYIQADFKDNRLRLKAKGFSGLIPLTDDPAIALHVTPRFPLTNLTRMVSECGYPPEALPVFRNYQLPEFTSDWMYGTLAEGLLIAFDTIRTNGLLRVYEQHTNISSYLHGRIDSTATMLKLTSRRISYKAQYSWYERTVDNPPNRCLKAAAQNLLNRYRFGSGSVKNKKQKDRTTENRIRIGRLGEMIRVLDEAQSDSSLRFLQDPQVRGMTPLPESKFSYRAALDIAVAILTDRGINLDASDGTVGLPSLIIKTEDLFESFIRISLQRSPVTSDEIEVLKGSDALYEAIPEKELRTWPRHTRIPKGKSGVEPDILFKTRDERYPLVADVKYTEVDGFADRSEVEQVVLYAIRYSSPVAMTIHPLKKGASRGLHLAGKIGNVIIAQYRFDLGNEDLDGEKLAMSTAIGDLLTSIRDSSAAVSV